MQRCEDAAESRPPLAGSLYDLGPAPAPPQRFNAARYCLAAAERTPDKIALTVAHAERDGWRFETWRYAALAAAIRRVAAGWRARGLAPGDRVVLRLGPTPRFPLLFFGVLAAGGVAVPTSAQLSAAEAAFIVADAEARFVCVEDALALDANVAIDFGDARTLGDAEIAALLATEEDGAGYADTTPETPAYIVYTSGATGRPKGVLHAHRTVWARRMMWTDWYGLTPTDRVLHTGAFNWTYTLGAGLMDPWAIGASTIVAATPPEPGAWPSLARSAEATLFAAVPSLYRRILKYATDAADGFAALRHGLTAGEKLPDAVRDAWRAATGLELYEALGMSECSTFISSAPSAPPRSGAIGRPQTGRRVAVLPIEPAPGSDGLTPASIGEVGVLAVDRADPGLMLGYWRRPEADAAARRGPWFLTGDLVEMDVDGYVAYRGRADDQMNAMGYRVAPQEVEDALLAHPAVAECAAAELEATAGVSIIAAFVVTRAPVDAPALRAHCGARLADYKVPRRVVFVDALPRTPTGKIRRRDLGALASTGR